MSASNILHLNAIVDEGRQGDKARFKSLYVKNTKLTKNLCVSVEKNQSETLFKVASQVDFRLFKLIFRLKYDIIPDC